MKTALDAPPARDAGPADAEVFGCGESERFVPLGDEIVLVAAGPGTESGDWQVVVSDETPPGNPLAAGEAPGRRRTFRADLPGVYVVGFGPANGVAGDGGSADAGGGWLCQVRIQVLSGPPVADCTEGEQLIPVGEPTVIEAGAYDDKGVEATEWTVDEAPESAGVVFQLEEDGATRVILAVPGKYRFRFTVTDSDGETGFCVAEVRAIAPPVVDCPGPLMVPSRQQVNFEAAATDDRTVVSVSWAVKSAPAASTAQPKPLSTPSSSLVPDKKGDYVLRFTATDDDGLTATCDLPIEAVPTPPTVTCPPTIDTEPLSSVPIQGLAEDDGTIVRSDWSLTDRPPGSQADDPTPANNPKATFTTDLAGTYELTFVAEDDDGNEASCSTEVRATPTEGLRVEMFWDVDRTDMDVHLAHPTAVRWFYPWDCHYANCAPGFSLMWGPGGGADDPHLDLDNTTGFGPENINVDDPEDGTYRVAVHAFNGRRADSRVTVRIFCGGNSLIPKATFGPVKLLGKQRQSLNDFWRVADVTVSGVNCTVTSLANAGVPNITLAQQAETTR